MGIRLFFFGILLISTLVWAPAADAHRDDYLNETLVYLTLERRELEAEYWLDLAHQTTSNETYSRHNAAVEWGMTDHWMVDGRLTAVSGAGRKTTLDSGRIETRLRFSEEGVRPVDVAASLELNWERQGDGSWITGLEPRVVLSRDFAEKLNFTANISEEVPLNGGSAETLVALGGRYNWTDLLRLGSEAQYDVDEHQGWIIPQVWVAALRHLTVKVGYAKAVDREIVDFARLALEAEF